MTIEWLIVGGLTVLILLCVVILLRTGRSSGVAELRGQIDALSTRLAELQSATASGFAGLREETSSQARFGREELGQRLDSGSAALIASVGQIGTGQGEKLEAFARAISHARIESQNEAVALRKDLLANFGQLTANVAERLDQAATRQNEALVIVTAAVKEMGETGVRRQEAMAAALTTSVKEMGDANERRGEGLRQSVETRLDAIRTENSAKLEEMRVTVDEKLQGTLEARLGASFTTVNENLERVFKSVGEMQVIATGVGDLKRVLTNVKLRGSFGEATLGMLLEQVMTADQYAQNVEIRPGSGCRVEYAIKLPGDNETPLWLPIDVKLPREDYERLVDASERSDVAGVEDAIKGLERTIRKCAADIRDKYVEPPHSTDFGIMFLPTEGLFAEVTRRPGLVDALQRDYRVIVAGPTTLMATLVSLRMGFRSLAIQKRSSEVWQVLGAVKTEFGKYGDLLDKVSKKLTEAQNVVDRAASKSKTVNQKLRSVEALPEAAAQSLLAISAEEVADDLEDAAE